MTMSLTDRIDDIILDAEAKYEALGESCLAGVTPFDADARMAMVRLLGCIAEAAANIASDVEAIRTEGLPQ